MNSLQRVLAAIHFQPTDRVPVMPQLFAHAAVLGGHTIGDYVSSGSFAADCQINALRHYGGDAVFAALDVCVEAAAVGCQISQRDDLYPAVSRPALTPDDDFTRLPLPEPQQEARMREVLLMAGRLRATVGDETPVIGVVQGPMTLALQFLGAETALYFAVDDSERFATLLDYGTEVALRFGVAQIAAGAHLCLVFEPGGCPEIVPVGLFREFLAPRLARLFAAFKAAGAPANWLHIAGQTLPILPLYPGIGAEIGNFDYPVAAEALIEHLPDRLCVDGNLKPLAFVDATADAIEAEGRRLIEAFRTRGGFILSSGCEIPPEAKPENIAALVRAAHRRA